MKRIILISCIAFASCSEPPVVAPPAKVPAIVEVAKTPAPPIDPAVLIDGTIPLSPPATDLLHSRCAICHTLDYVTQQRLTRPQWEKTLAKMQKWGAPINPAETSSLAAFLSSNWKPELPERASKRVERAKTAAP